jgi:hypothetical protein
MRYYVVHRIWVIPRRPLPPRRPTGCGPVVLLMLCAVAGLVTAAGVALAGF